MEKLTTINLAGNAFQFEEPGFVKLSAYLKSAREKLAGNPDVDEIMNDFEVAIAQKCRSCLSPHKTVITDADVEKIIAEMGPVENDAPGAASDAAAPKRLYRIKEGSMVGGICTGLAAYFNIDVTIIRIIFVILALISSGVWAGVYIVMMMIIPVAETPEERARAFGTTPITAQGLIDSAKEGYERFKNSKEWQNLKHQAHEHTREWHQSRQARHAEQMSYNHNYQYSYSPFWSFMHSLLGLVWTVLIAVGLWFLYHNSVVAKESMDIAGTAIQNTVSALIEAWQNH